MSGPAIGWCERQFLDLEPELAEPPPGVLGRPFGMLTRRRGRHDERGAASSGINEETVLRFVARVQLVATDERERPDAHPLRSAGNSD